MINGNGLAPKAYWDEKRKAWIQEDIHLLPENLAAAVQKEYHTYNVEALEHDVVSLDASVETFREHIAKEKKRRAELLVLIEEGKERDEKLKALGF